jgi:exodeoxyribonuclease VII small subunit
MKEIILEKKKQPKDKLTFESALKKLEQIANQLEDGSLGLEKSIDEFETGIRLAKYCRGKLDEAERKVEILQKGGDGDVKKKQVRVKEDTGEIDDDEDLQGTLL